MVRGCVGLVAPTTIRQARSVIDRYLKVHLGTVRVGELSAFTIDEAYVRLRAGGGSQGQPLSAGTLARVHVVLRSALAQRWGWIFDNPAERASRIKVHLTERRPLTPAEVRNYHHVWLGPVRKLPARPLRV